MNKGNKTRALSAAILGIGLSTLILWGFLRPAAVIEGGIKKLATAQTQQFNALIQIENPQTTQQLFGEAAIIELTVNGVFQRREPERESLKADVFISAKTESITMQIEAEVIFIGDKAYVLIKKAPPTLTPLAQLKGLWLELPRGGVEQENQIAEADEKLFTSIKRDGSVEVAGRRVSQYQTQATAIGVLHMIDSIADVLGTRLTTEQVNNFRTGVADVQSIPVSIAAKPLTREIKQIQTSFAVPGGQNTITFQLTFGDRNIKVDIVAPENAVTLQELVQNQPAQQ